tara:strand:- start:155 stop:391 length:237 start_codon:yes stop_codon:yes gene_type:complete
MYKNYFHNNKKSIENNDQEKYSQVSKVETTRAKGIVDINILLNRVKLDQKNEKKRKAVLIISIVLLIALSSVSITIIS